MDDTPEEPLIRYSVPPDQWSVEMIAALTDDKFDDFIADIFEGFPNESEADIEESLRQAEADIAAGRVRPAREAILEIAARYGILVDGEIGSDAARERAERVAKLRRSMADFAAGRYRPAKDVMREIAAEHGFALEG